MDKMSQGQVSCHYFGSCPNDFLTPTIIIQYMALYHPSPRMKHGETCVGGYYKATFFLDVTPLRWVETQSNQLPAFSVQKYDFISAKQESSFLKVAALKMEATVSPKRRQHVQSHSV
jgi:hypothetical protein